MIIERQTFTPNLLARPVPRRHDVVTLLQHFAIITYEVDPERLRAHLHPRFEPLLIAGERGAPRALLSVVPFLDKDFHFHGLPQVRFAFGQTNYRAYVRDRESGTHAVWFFGTVLDSLAVLIPRHLWRLPWHRGRIGFDARWDASANRYVRYRMSCAEGWAPAQLELEDTGRPVEACRGFPDLETGLVLLTHPLSGYYYRRDGALGSYTIWHSRLQPTVGHVAHARFALLDRLELVPHAEQQAPHSCWLQRQTEFTIYLPPHTVQ
jgi:hypothetical protein